jgi:hypothetical protein
MICIFLQNLFKSTNASQINVIPSSEVRILPPLAHGKKKVREKSLGQNKGNESKTFS